MKVSFKWEISLGTLNPVCHTDIHNADGVSILACILTDDGGQGYIDSIPWLIEGLRRIDNVSSMGSQSISWDRDAWGAAISKSHVVIYSLYDDSYSETLSVDAFKKALSAWIEFIQSEPSIDNTVTLTI